MSNHTDEPWLAVGDALIRGPHGEPVATTKWSEHPSDPRFKANRRRILAAVHACAGISTEALEKMGQDALKILPDVQFLRSEKKRLIEASEQLYAKIVEVDQERGCCTCIPEAGRVCMIHRITGMVLNPNPYAPEREKHMTISTLYAELMYAVERVFPNESRHQTALRYIRETEGRSGSDVGLSAPHPREEHGRNPNA